MKKHILSAMTVLVMVCGLFVAMPAAKANAILQTDVSGKLNSLMNQYVGKRGSWSFAGGSQCYGFAHMIFNNIFGRGSAQVGNGALSSNRTNYRLNNVARDITTIGTLGPGYSAASLENLLEKATPGDYIQVRRKSGTPHSMICAGINAQGNTIAIFDANSDGVGTVKHYAQSFGAFMSKNSGVSVYRYSGYSSNVGHNPEGVVDSASGGSGVVNVGGWTFDRDSTGQSIDVHVYIGGPAGSGEGHAITANKPRGDVNNAYGIGGNHGFADAIATKKTGRQDVYFYAINIGGGDNVFIGKKTVNITAMNPEGVVDSAKGGSGVINVGGWAFDRDSTGRSIDVHVYIGGPAGSGEGHAITANKPRGDVNNAYGIGGNHGFADAIATKKTGRQDVYFYAINIGGGDNVFIGKKTVNITAMNPEGVVDSASGGSGVVNVGGWAFDRDSTGRSIDVHVYIGGPAGSGEGHAITANKPRGDVNNAYGIGGNHGFADAIATKKTGRQDVYFYAINIGGGDNVFIGKKTVNIASGNPQGVVDIVKGETGAVFIRGWAFDPNSVGQSIDIHVYIGGPAGSGEGHAIRAASLRPDVNKAYNINGNHGFNETIETKKTGRQAVYVYAINVGSGDNILIGSGAVNIAGKKQISNGTIVSVPTQSYTGKAIVPDVTVKYKGSILKEGTDYTLDYSNNTNVGTATITATGKGKYTGSIKTTFKIDKKEQIINVQSTFEKTTEDSPFSLKAKAEGALTYQSDNADVAAIDNGMVVIKGVGTANIMIYAAETSIYKSASKTVLITVQESVQTGEEDDDKAPQSIFVDESFVKIFGDKPFNLNATTNGDGELYYESDDPDVAEVDEFGNVDLNSIGEAVITITADDTENYNEASREVAIIVRSGEADTLPSLKVKTVTGVKVKVLGKKKMVVKWTKVQGASGYRIAYAQDSKFTENVKRIKVDNVAKKKIKRLNPGSTYYVKVRAYKVIGSQTFYGNYSKVKKIKTEQ